MRMRGLALGALLLTLALAGCSDDGGGDSTTTSSTGSPTTSASVQSSSSSTTSASSATTSSSSSSTAPTANRAPTGSISAVIDGTNATFSLTGTDPDGDTLTWELAFGDGQKTTGTTLPATAVHDYGAAGDFTANFTVTDGKASTSYEVLVTAVAAGGNEPIQTVAGGWAVGVADAGATSEIALCGSSPLSGVTHLHFPVDAMTQGKPFAATIADASGGAAIQDWGILFFDATCLAFESVSATGPAPLAGTVPATAAVAVVIATGGVMLELAYAAG